MKKEIKISGMHCEHCKARIEKALSDLEGVKAVKVDLKKACAVVECTDSCDDSVLKNTVEELGFEAGTIEVKKGFFGK